MMSTKKYFFRYSIPIFCYFLICTLIIIIKINYYSPPAFEINETNIPNNTSFITISEVEYENILQKRLDVRSDETIDLPKIDSTIDRIYTVCEKYNKVTQLEPRHFLYSSDHNTLFCWIRKVASKSFTKFFADLKGVKILGDTYDKEINSFDVENMEELTNLIDNREVFKFLAVRHPFERLVASYRDRIENNSRYTAQAWIYAPKILHITQPELFHRNKSNNPLDKIFDNDRRLQITPTFEEFVIWLLKQPDNHSDDFHWNQYYSHCSICQVPFDYVLKLDNYSIKDINYILDNIGIDKNKWQLPQIGENNKGSTNFDITCSYLSSLTKYMFYKLFERYKIDFEMFDYDLKLYKMCIER